MPRSSLKMTCTALTACRFHSEPKQMFAYARRGREGKRCDEERLSALSHKAQDEQIHHELLAQVMVHPKHVAAGQASEVRHERLARGRVVPKRLLEHEALLERAVRGDRVDARCFDVSREVACEAA